MRLGSLLVLIGMLGLLGGGARASESGGAFVRLKSGVLYPESNGIVSDYTPIAADGVYRLAGGRYGIGLGAIFAKGNHQFGAIAADNPVPILDMRRTMFLALATGFYFFDFGSARVGAGLKAGALCYSQSASVVGVSGSDFDSSTTTRLTVGPALDVDLPLKGDFFVNVGGDYLFSQRLYNFGSLYVGLGLNL